MLNESPKPCNAKVKEECRIHGDRIADHQYLPDFHHQQEMLDRVRRKLRTTAKGWEVVHLEQEAHRLELQVAASREGFASISYRLEAETASSTNMPQQADFRKLYTEQNLLREAIALRAQLLADHAITDFRALDEDEIALNPIKRLFYGTMTQVAPSATGEMVIAVISNYGDFAEYDMADPEQREALLRLRRQLADEAANGSRYGHMDLEFDATFDHGGLIYGIWRSPSHPSSRYWSRSGEILADFHFNTNGIFIEAYFAYNELARQPARITDLTVAQTLVREEREGRRKLAALPEIAVPKTWE